jgi:hypothetical protein
VFYNRSAFDGNNPAADVSDDSAIATDKVALLPGGSATFANYTSYSRGINGIMVDVAGLPAGTTLTAADFAFKVGNNDTPDAWADAPAPVSVTVRDGAGVGSSARVTLVWPDGAIKGKWLRVTVRANGRTRLAADDVFYFGNAPGESGNFATAAVVNTTDELAARHRPRGAGNPAPVTFNWDYNRDRRVDSRDWMTVRANRTTASTALRLITAPPPSAQSSSSAARPVAPRAGGPSLGLVSMSRVGPGAGGDLPADELDDALD